MITHTRDGPSMRKNALRHCHRRDMLRDRDRDAARPGRSGQSGR